MLKLINMFFLQLFVQNTGLIDVAFFVLFSQLQHSKNKQKPKIVDSEVRLLTGGYPSFFLSEKFHFRVPEHRLGQSL